MKRLLLLCSAVLLLAACTQENDFGNKPTYKVDYSGVEVTESTLSVEQAMNNMNFVYRNFEGKEHKIRKIRKVEMLTTGNLRPTSLTRSGLGEDAEDQPLAYVVNFEEEAGYAILAADAQLPPIIMLGDEGNFSTQNYLEFLQRTETRSGDSDFDPSNVQDLQYAIVTNSLSFPGNGSVATIGCSDTVVLLKCWPLLKTKWGQGSPYNLYSPVRGNAIAPAGCTPVAIAQIMASLAYHHNFRQAISASDADGGPYSFNMETLSKIVRDTMKYESNQYTSGAMEIASLIRSIGAYANATYAEEQTSVAELNIAPIFQAFNLTNVLLSEYNKSKLFEMVVGKQLPTYIGAVRETEEGDLKGHSFVVDGWLRLEYTRNFRQILPGQIINNLVNSNFDLVHCNFGYNGNCDGYYLPESYDLSSVEFDDFVEEGDNPSYAMARVYNLQIKQISYDK